MALCELWTSVMERFWEHRILKMSITAAILVVFNIEPHKKSVKRLLRIQDDPRRLFFGCPKQFRIGAWIGKRHKRKEEKGRSPGVFSITR
jgi:hypothetical protein